MSEELAELIGFHVGDGYCNVLYRKRRVDYTIEYLGNIHSISEIEYYNTFLRKALLNLFNFRLYPKKRSKGTFGFTFRSKALLMFYKNVIGLPIGKKSHIVRVPELIAAAPFTIKAAFIRGLFRADGCIRLKRKDYPLVKLTSASKNLILDVYSMLINMGFRPSLSLNQKQFDKRTKKLYLRYELYLYGHKNYEIWNRKIEQVPC